MQSKQQQKILLKLLDNDTLFPQHATTGLTRSNIAEHCGKSLFLRKMLLAVTDPWTNEMKGFNSTWTFVVSGL